MTRRREACWLRLRPTAERHGPRVLERRRHCVCAGHRGVRSARALRSALAAMVRERPRFAALDVRGKPAAARRFQNIEPARWLEHDRVRSRTTEKFLVARSTDKRGATASANEFNSMRSATSASRRREPGRRLSRRRASLGSTTRPALSMVRAVFMGRGWVDSWVDNLVCSLVGRLAASMADSMANKLPNRLPRLGRRGAPVQARCGHADQATKQLRRKTRAGAASADSRWAINQA